MVAEADELTGQAIVAFVTLNGTPARRRQGGGRDPGHVGVRIGKLARPKWIIWADDLPKTRSGKIMRRLLRDIAEGHELGDVTTLRDPAVVQDLQAKAAAARHRQVADPGRAAVSESILVAWSEALLEYDMGVTHPMAPGRLEFTWCWLGTSTSWPVPA